MVNVFDLCKELQRETNVCQRKKTQQMHKDSFFCFAAAGGGRRCRRRYT